MDATTAGYVSSVLMVAGMVGSLAVTTLMGKTGRRKIWTLIGIGGFFVFSMLITIMNGTFALVVVIALAGAIYYLFSPTIAVMIIEIIEPFDPIRATTGFAFCFGAPMVVSLSVSPVFQALLDRTDDNMTLVLQIFFLLSLASFIICAIFLKETGPHRKDKGRFVKTEAKA
jgi:MFS family permease